MLMVGLAAGAALAAARVAGAGPCDDGRLLPLGPYERAKQTACMSNLKQIFLTIVMYRNDHDDRLPPDLKTLVDRKYLTNRKVLHCPSATPREDGIDYVMVKTEGKNFADTDVLVYDRKGNHDEGRNVLLYNGQVIWLTEEEFKNRMGNQPYQ